MKIDVEGAEGLVLAGAERLLDHYRPIVTMEFSPEMLSRVSGVNPKELLQHVCARGYYLMMLDRSGGSQQETPVDDVDVFVRDYGSEFRIEDLVFRPRGR